MRPKTLHNFFVVVDTHLTLFRSLFLFFVFLVDTQITSWKYLSTTLLSLWTLLRLLLSYVLLCCHDIPALSTCMKIDDFMIDFETY